MIGIVLALAASVGWGVADFLGGLKSRSTAVLIVLLVSQGVGVLALTFSVFVASPKGPTLQSFLFGSAAGFAALLGIGSLYRGLVVGAMSIVTPISATGAAIPVFIGLLTGERPSSIQGAGVILALAGVVLAAREPSRGTRTRIPVASGVGLALLGAVGFGVFLSAIDIASDDGVLWAMLFQRVALVGVVLALIVIFRAPLALQHTDLTHLVVLGLIALSSDLLYAAASTQGLVSIVSVLGAMYPVTTVVLAHLILGERIGDGQRLGVFLAILGVVSISAG